MPARSSRIDYLASLFDRPALTLSLQSGPVELHRLGLGPHFRLQALGTQIGQVTLEERTNVLHAWLETAGVGDIEHLSLSDLPVLIRAVKDLNAPQGRLAWDELAVIAEPGAPSATDYPGRGLARIVDTLARHYGWSLEEILALSPEAALAHVQECALADRRRREWEHMLSEISWEYDKGSHSSHYRPLPPLPWETLPVAREYAPVPEHVKEKYYPKGVIIDLTKSDGIPLGRKTGDSQPETGTIAATGLSHS